MKNTSRSRLLLSGVLSLVVSLSACSKSLGTSITAATTTTATQVSAEFCAQIGVVGATKTSSKGASVMTLGYDGLVTGASGQTTFKRAANGNMSLNYDERTLKYLEITTPDAVQRLIETPEATYIAYTEGYVDGLRNDQWVRFGKGTAGYPETSLKEFFDAVDRSEWSSGSSSGISGAAANAVQVQVVAEGGLCKYSFKDTESSYTIAIDSEERLRSYGERSLDGSEGAETSFEYSTVEIETPAAADLAPASVVEDVRARQQEFEQNPD